MKYEWDTKKARRNEVKHGVTFEEAMSALKDPLSEEFDDPDHSIYETRKVLVGLSHLGRLLVISFTERLSKTRIISARLATRWEQKDYER